MLNQNEKVRQYFDSIANSYPERFTSKRPFHSYFFIERLRLATQDFDFKGRSILDIGAGTGILYDFLNESCTHFEYFGNDLSLEMLTQSNIPKEYQVSGEVYKIEFKNKGFDFIFLLGVTSYMSMSEMKKVFFFINENLKSDGRVIISFSNKKSLDFFFRQVLYFLMKMLRLKRGLIGQNFKTTSIKTDSLRRLIPAELKIEKQIWFNYTFSPINQLFPNWSIYLSKRIAKLKPSGLKHFLGADFLVIFSKQS
ncbi:MAG: class I SAM-dependent methyltransferase [Bacteroidetes bacterium]|jgi:ubiquinone/menaquinone biosynthesis C-methylase UbiE|nr:class I SAM-dependent methyltransferase [Bacteroidota bacterium]